MADTFSIGLPNQALKARVSSYTPIPEPRVPYNLLNLVPAVVAGVETDVIAAQTVPANKALTLTDILVRCGVDDFVFRIYKNGVVVATFAVDAADATQRVPLTGALVLDEGDVFKVMAVSPTGGYAEVALSGHEDLKAERLFSPVLA